MSVTIRSTTNPADVFDGPDGAQVPPGYELVPSAAALPAARTGTGGVVDPPTGKETRPSSWMTKLPAQPLSAVLPVKAARLMAGMDQPQGLEDVALLALGNTLPIGAGGMAARAALPMIPRLAAPLGRIATSIGLSKVRGEDNTTAAIEGIGATGAEAGLGLLSKAVGGPARALAGIREIIGKGPTGRVNIGVFNSLIKRWSESANAPTKTINAAGTPAGTPGPVSQKIKGIVPFLEEEDPTGIAALMFKDLVAKGGKVWPMKKALPPVNSKLSEVAEAVLKSPLARGAADASMSADPTPGALTGDLAVMGVDRALSAPGQLMRLLK